MSDLYKAIISESKKNNAVNIKITAVNNDGQIVQTEPVFYFAIIGSIYMELCEFHNQYGFGIMVDKYSSKEKINFKIPILEEYIEAINKYKKEGYQGPILKTFKNQKRINQLMNITVKNKTVNKYKCAEGEIELEINSKELFDIMTKVKQVGIAFDENYFF